MNALPRWWCLFFPLGWSEILAMVIGVLQFELLIPHSESLKDKRRVVKSLKDRLHREHLVSVAEVDALDEHRTAIIGVAAVANDAAYVSGVLDRVVEKLRTLHDARLGVVSRDLIHGSTLEWDAEEGAEATPVWSEEEVHRLATEAERALREENP